MRGTTGVHAGRRRPAPLPLPLPHCLTLTGCGSCANKPSATRIKGGTECKACCGELQAKESGSKGGRDLGEKKEAQSTRRADEQCRLHGWHAGSYNVSNTSQEPAQWSGTDRVARYGVQRRLLQRRQRHAGDVHREKKKNKNGGGLSCLIHGAAQANGCSALHQRPSMAPAACLWVARGSSRLSGAPLGFPPQRCACSCTAVGEVGRKVGSQVKPGAEPPRLCKAPSPLPSTDACACRCTVERGIEGNEEPSQSPQEADPSSSQ